MPDKDVTLGALYDWTCRVEDEISDLRSSFPEGYRVDRDRVIMSLSCLRVSLEVRVKCSFPKRPAPPVWEHGPLDPRPRLNR